MSKTRTSRVLSNIGLELVETPDLEESDETLIEFVRTSPKSTLLGSGPSADAEICKWLSFARGRLTTDSLDVLDHYLSTNATRTYLAINKFTIADVAVFVSVDETFQPSSFSSLVALTRWYNQIQRLTTIMQKKNKDKVKTDKVVQVDDEIKTNSRPLIVDLDPSNLDIRVGLVVKCWNHPESDKLLCEEIDLGEGTTRFIASGLRAYYTAKDIQGRKVLVMTNLKARAMGGGYKSHGMLICAVGDGRVDIKLIDPPADAAIGERVSFPGFNSQPLPAKQIANKKIFEALAPGLRTDENGVAHWSNSPFTLANGVCRTDLPNAMVM